MERFLTGDVWKQANGLVNARSSKIACIAYVTSTKLKLRKGDELFCDASAFAIAFGETSAKAIRHYFRKGVNIHSVRNLHSKLLLTDKLLIIGSANLSRNSAELLTESALATTNQQAISQAKAFCHNLAMESPLMKAEEISILLQIKVKKSRIRPRTLTKTRRKKFGSKAWFITVGTLSDREYESYREKDAYVSGELSSEFGLEEDDIGFIKWPMNSDFAKTSRPGDLLLIKSTNEHKTRTEVWPPSPLLRKERVGKRMLLWHKQSDAEMDLTWTAFSSKVRKMSLIKRSFQRSGQLTEDELEELNQIWRHRSKK